MITTRLAYRVDSGAGIEGLRLGEEPLPRLDCGEVLVRVSARAISYRELLVLRGEYVLPVRPRVIPVCEGAGEVVDVSADVTRVRVGDRVTANVFAHWTDESFTLDRADQLGGSLDGWLTDLAVLPEGALLPVPDHLSDAEAAALPCTALAAWHALEGVGPGATVLTLGTGGVSLAAVQLAGAAGATVIATTRRADRAERLLALGAQHVIEARPDWDNGVRDLTAHGVDRVVDVVGDVARSLRAVRPGGEVAYVGYVGGSGNLDAMELFASAASVRAVPLGSRRHFTELLRTVEKHALRPLLDEHYTFEDAPAAFRRLASGDAFGKVIISDAARDLVQN